MTPQRTPRSRRFNRGVLAAGVLMMAGIALGWSIAAAPAGIPSGIASQDPTASPVAAASTPTATGTPSATPPGPVVAAGPAPPPAVAPGLAAEPPEPSKRTEPTVNSGSAGGGTRVAKTDAAHRVATRVVVPDLRIDLPVIRQPASYPSCNVAMYLKELRQPGGKGATYLYAHARRGMFLPILDASLVNNGARMIGMKVLVYTSDERVFEYRISSVRRHITTLNAAFAIRTETLWLQTSEGPKGTPGKTQVIAKPVSEGPATADEARPRARPKSC